MKTILLTATYLVGAGELALAIFFWVTHSKSEIRKVMALLAFSTSVWSITNAMTSYVNPSKLVDIALGLIFVAGVFIVTILIHFTLIFPFRLFLLDRLHFFLLYLPAFIFSLTASFTKTIVSSYMVALDNPGFVNKGPLFVLYEVYISVLFLTALMILSKRIKKLDGLHKKNTKIVFWSILVGGTPAIIFNLWFVFFGILVNPLVPVLFGLAWVGGTTWILLKD